MQVRMSQIDGYRTTRSDEFEEISTVGREISTETPLNLDQDTKKSIKDVLFNGTGYYIDEEGEAGSFLAGFYDLQTVFIACISTLVLLGIIVSITFGIRMLWKRYRRHKHNLQYDGILHREETSESISRPLHSHLLSDKPCGDTHLAINTEDVELCDGTEINSQIRSNNHSSTNGSIITMTLKNNHLIVETEERNDIEEDSRETKMKYSPGARNGVFVVEVQQGVRRSPGSGGPTSCAEAEVSVSVSDQCALVHNPPDRYSDEETLEECDDSEYYMETTSPNTETPDSLSHQLKTGLARSNSSLTRPSYCYTTQQCYDTGSHGYNVYEGYVNDEPPRRLPDDTRPKIMAAVYKNPSRMSCTSVDIPLVTFNGLKEAINDIEKSSDEETEEQRRRDSMNLLRETSKYEKSAEPDIGSVDHENKGLDCCDAPKS